MPTHCTTLPYAETGAFSGLLTDYIAQKPELAPFYHRFPSLENVAAQLEEKRAAYTPEARKRLVAALRDQYGLAPEPEPAIEANLLLLGEPTTFTVTTGHQLNLLTGPLYFIYKIATAIKLSRQLKEAYPQYDFVPVYWMATEDHDFAEINHFSLFGKTYSWDAANTGGPRGPAPARRFCRAAAEPVAARGTRRLPQGVFNLKQSGRSHSQAHRCLVWRVWVGDAGRRPARPETGAGAGAGAGNSDAGVQHRRAGHQRPPHGCGLQAAGVLAAHQPIFHHRCW